MSDQSRVITGFDCEFLIGGDYLTRIFDAAYRSGNFLNQNTLNNPVIGVILEQYGVAVDSYTIKIKGTIAKHCFAAIPGIDTIISEDIYNYLDNNKWLSNHTLVRDFDPENEQLAAYLKSNYNDASTQIIEHLNNALYTTDLDIEEPYHTAIYDDNRPLKTLLADTFISVSEADIDKIVGYLQSSGLLDNSGILASEYKEISVPMFNWLDGNIPEHQYLIIYLLRDYCSYDHRGPLRDYLLQALVVLPEAELEQLMEFCRANNWLTGGGMLYPKVDKILDRIEPWLDEHLPEIKERILSLLGNQPDIRTHIPIKLEGMHTYANGDSRYIGEDFYEIVLFIPMEINSKEIKLGDPIVHHHSAAVLNSWGNMVEKKNLGSALIDFIKAVLPDRFNINLLPADSVRHIEFKKLKSSDNYAPAYGIYCNLGLDLRSLPSGFAVEYYSKPQNLVGEKVEVSSEGQLLVKDQNDREIDPKYLLYSMNEPDKNNDTILYHSIGNVSLQSIKLDEQGHLVVEYKNGQIPTPDEIVEIAQRNLPRGNIHKAQNFLRAGNDFALGIGQPVLRRFERSQWNSFYKKLPEGIPAIFGEGHRPVLDANEKQIGKYTDFDLSWQKDGIKCVIELEYFVDYFPDADVYCRVMIRPSINDYKLVVDAEIEKFNVDTGIAGDILAFIIGTITLGPLGMVGGVVALEVAEYAIAESQKQQQEQSIKSQTAGLFNIIPRVMELFTSKGSDVNYYVGYGPTQLYTSILLDEEGMIMAGAGGVGTVNHSLNVSLVGRTRDPESWELVDLVYRDGADKESSMPCFHAKYRIRDGSLQRVNLVPQAQYRKNGRIHSLRFDSGVDLQIFEIIHMIRDGIIFVPGVFIHVTSTGYEYLRTRPDRLKDNNLSELPQFQPVDI